MPALDKNTNLYEQCELVCSQIKGKRNLSQKDLATITVKTILADAQDLSGQASVAALKKGEKFDPLAYLMEDSQRELRAKIRDNVKFTFTASKNFQNVYLKPSGLMPKATGEEKQTEEFA